MLPIQMVKLQEWNLIPRLRLWPELKSTVLHCQGVFKNKKIVEKSQKGPLQQPINWGLFLNESKRIMKNQLCLLSLVLAASENFFIKFDLKYHLQGTHVNWKLSFLQKGLKTYKFWSLKTNFEAFQKSQDPPPTLQGASEQEFVTPPIVLPFYLITKCSNQ